MASKKNGNGGAAAAEPVRPGGVVPPPDRRDSDRLIRTRSLESERKPKNPFVAFFTSRRFIGFCITALIFYLIIAIPHWLWEMTPDVPLQLTVVDKTVPFKNYREHRALFWLLNQNKIVKKDASGQDRFYDYSRDYVGAHPTNSDGTERETGLLTADIIKDTDILYFADTYGVYDADYTQFEEKDIAATEHSSRFFGGLEETEVAATEAFAKRKGTIIGEFSTFASPTDAALRARMEKVMGVRWTGWIGRYFVDFRDEKDVPKWLYDLYRKRYKKEWDISGSGYMLCKDESEDFIILLDETSTQLGDVYRDGLEFVPLGAFSNHDVMEGVNAAKFTYWFDIMEKLGGTEELAQYQWNLTETGRKKLADKGLNLVFPAVMRKKGESTVYYFAGEYVDFFRAMGRPDTRATLYINRSFYGRPIAGSTEYFFWSTAYPLITNILRREANRLTGQPKNVYLFDEDNLVKSLFSQ